MANNLDAIGEEIIGLEDFEKNLAALPTYWQQKDALVKAAQAGAQIVQDDAERRAPRRFGNLAAGMTMKTDRSSGPDAAVINVGPGKKQFYGMFAEFGTKNESKREFLLVALESNRERVIDAIRVVLSAHLWNGF